MARKFTPTPGARLRKLLARKDRVLSVMHPPTAMHARIMEEAGAEAAFIGTSGVVGAYTGMSDVGTATMTECVMISGWVAQSVKMPIIMDGDTGHGGVMAVRRMVRECIKAGLAGVRIDDQPIEGKRRTSRQARSKTMMRGWTGRRRGWNLSRNPNRHGLSSHHWLHHGFPKPRRGQWPNRQCRRPAAGAGVQRSRRPSSTTVGAPWGATLAPTAAGRAGSSVELQRAAVAAAGAAIAGVAAAERQV